MSAADQVRNGGAQAAPTADKAYDVPGETAPAETSAPEAKTADAAQAQTAQADATKAEAEKTDTARNAPKVEGGSKEAQDNVASASKAVTGAMTAAAQKANEDGNYDGLSQALTGKNFKDLDGAGQKAIMDTNNAMAKGEIKPDMVIAQNAPTADPAKGDDSLPEGTNGAFVKDDKGGQGTVMINEKVAAKDSADLVNTVAEEFGEAVADRFKQNLAQGEKTDTKLAEGDAGVRISANTISTMKGEEPTITSDKTPEAFAARNSDSGTVTLNGQEVEAKTNQQTDRTGTAYRNAKQDGLNYASAASSKLRAYDFRIKQAEDEYRSAQGSLSSALQRTPNWGNVDQNTKQDIGTKYERAEQSFQQARNYIQGEGGLADWVDNTVLPRARQMQGMRNQQGGEQIATAGDQLLNLATGTKNDYSQLFKTRRNALNALVDAEASIGKTTEGQRQMEKIAWQNTLKQQEAAAKAEAQQIRNNNRANWGDVFKSLGKGYLSIAKEVLNATDALRKVAPPIGSVAADLIDQGLNVATGNGYAVAKLAANGIDNFKANIEAIKDLSNASMSDIGGAIGSLLNNAVGGTITSMTSNDVAELEKSIGDVGEGSTARGQSHQANQRIQNFNKLGKTVYASPNFKDKGGFRWGMEKGTGAIIGTKTFRGDITFSGDKVTAPVEIGMKIRLNPSNPANSVVEYQIKGAGAYTNTTAKINIAPGVTGQGTVKFELGVLGSSQTRLNSLGNAGTNGLDFTLKIKPGVKIVAGGREIFKADSTAKTINF